MTRGIVHSDETLCTATDDRLAIGIWHGEPTLHHMEILEDMVRERVRLYGKAILLIIVERPVLPAEASRTRMVQIMDRYKDSLTAIAVVLEVQGPFGTALRALGRGVVVASRSHTPTFMVGTVGEAVTALRHFLVEVNLDAARLVQTVSDVRQRYSSSLPPAHEITRV